MSKRDKRIEAMRRNPRNVQPTDLHFALVALGFSWDQDGTSHRTYRRDGHKLSVPQHKPHLKPKYVEQALAVIDAVGLLEDE